jgi:hypothetical protein
MYHSKKNKEVFLSVGHPEGKSSDFALAAFLDWKQIPFPDRNHQRVHYVTLEKGKREVFPLKLPQVQRESNFQVIAFPKPYQISESDFGSQTVYGSPRIVIQP